MQQLDGKIPDGPLPEKWDRHRRELKLVSPANRRRFNIIVVGTGLAGASASATTTGVSSTSGAVGAAGVGITGAIIKLASEKRSPSSRR